MVCNNYIIGGFMRTFLFFISALLLLACNQTTNSKTVEQANIELASKYFTDVYNKNNHALIDELFIENYEHTGTSGSSWVGLDNLKKIVPRIKKMFPNLKIRILETTADNQKVAFLVNFEADMPQFAKPGLEAKNVNFSELFIFWVSDNKIYKGRSLGAHWEVIKQTSGFQGTLAESVKILSKYKGSGEVEK